MAIWHNACAPARSDKPESSQNRNTSRVRANADCRPAERSVTSDVRQHCDSQHARQCPDSPDATSRFRTGRAVVAVGPVGTLKQQVQY